MPLTRRGWAFVTGSLAAGAAGRTLGVLELFVLAAGGIGLVCVAVLTVLLRRRVAVEGTRRLVPARVHAGADSRVELRVSNQGDRTTPVLTLRDTVVQVRTTTSATVRQARFRLAPLRAGEADRAAYRLGAERRGIFRVGPLEAVVGDPFGLASSTRQAAPATELTVYPRIEPVAAPPFTSGHDPRAGGGHPTFLGSGDEFYGLRAYEVGDDLRRVHWPSTARQDELMIRQHEVPWHGRATVVLDVRAEAHTDDSFEDAVSAAASLLTAAWHGDAELRLLTTDGLDSGFGSGPSHLSAAMEHLAVVEPGSGRLDTLAGLLRQRATGAAVLFTTARAGLAPVAPLVRPGGYAWVALVLIGVEPGDRHPTPQPGRTGLTVAVQTGRSFAEAWNAALASAPAGTATAVRR